MDVPERIHAGLAKLDMPQRMSDIVATEFSILYYGVAAWRRRPFAATRSSAFSYHKKSGLLALLYTVLATAVIELAALELLLRVRHHVAANVFLGVNALAVLWILGYARSVQLRPMLVTADTLLVRGGMQWSLDIPRSAIETVAVGRVGASRLLRGRSEHFLTCSHADASVRLRRSV